MSEASRSLRRMSKQTALGILSDIRRVLWEQWDPIGVNDEPGAFGEYDGYAGYAGAIYDLLMQGASDDAIARQLHTYETVNMGMGQRTKERRNEQRVAVVRALRAVDLDPLDAP